ncbi:MAG: hypothetical protein KDK53_00010 [Maritimibacter sp.]|nr:hypothetical protein [Maritimibacter sp.]
MGRLLVLFFLMPWWAYVPASLGVLWLGERVYEQALETEAEKAAALEAAAPGPIDIGTFDRARDIHPADEVNVVGLIDHNLDYELVQRTNGVPTKTRYLYMLFGADEYGSKVVRGALMLDKGEEAAFIDGKADEWAVDATADYWVYAFNGFGKRSATLSEMVDDAIAEQGLTKAQDFIFIEPFFEGREAALAAHGVPDQTRQIFWGIAAFVALIGVVKRVKSVRTRPAPEAEEAVDLTQLDPEHTAPEPEIYAATAAAYAAPEGIEDDTPIGRLARRSGTRPAPAHEEASVYRTYRAPDPEFDDDAPQAADAFDDPYYADEPAGTFAYEDDAGADGIADTQVAAQAGAAAQPGQKSSAASFYAKLALGMLLVGTLAYDPSLLTSSLPIAGIALFWFGVFVVVRRLRKGTRQLVGRVKPAPQHSRRPDGVAQRGAV